ncbi:MAG: crotonase/enoyl-CoA hydratase family protein [Nocardioidaceae bacterium]
MRAVILVGDGDAFCAGLDFATVMKTPQKLAIGLIPRPWRGTNTFQEACWVWRRLPVPVIAAVHGHCLGGGLQLALAADFRITTPDAQWSVLEGKWGLIPDMTGVQALSELVGIETAKRLTMTAEFVTGAQAHELGLVGAVAAKPDQAALDLAHALTKRSPDALAGAKRLFNNTWSKSPRVTFLWELIEQLQLLGRSNNTAAQKAAFAKTEPIYRKRARR